MVLLLTHAIIRLGDEAKEIKIYAIWNNLHTFYAWHVENLVMYI